MAINTKTIQHDGITVETSFDNFDILDKFENTIKQNGVSRDVLDDIGRNMEVSAKNILSQAGHNKTEKLKNSIKYELEKDTIILSAQEPYASYIEYGFMHNTSDGSRFVGPFPYLRPAMESTAIQSQEQLEKYLIDVFEEKYSFNNYKSYKKETLQSQSKINLKNNLSKTTTYSGYFKNKNK